jgi:hypothetical protein
MGFTSKMTGPESPRANATLCLRGGIRRGKMGQGFGLSIAKEVATAHDWNI